MPIWLKRAPASILSFFRTVSDWERTALPQAKSRNWSGDGGWQADCIYCEEQHQSHHHPNASGKLRVVVKLGGYTPRTGDSKRVFAMTRGVSQITRLLKAWSGGDQAALKELLPLVYNELRKTARRYMKNERAGNTLQVTGLVNEAGSQRQNLNEWLSDPRKSIGRDMNFWRRNEDRLPRSSVFEILGSRDVRIRSGELNGDCARSG